jgi:hypothetical protein
MYSRHTRTRTAIAVIPALTATLLAVSIDPASAATGGGTLLCPNTLLTTQVAPFPIGVTANPTSPKAPTGAGIAVNGATVTLTVPGPVVGGFHAQANANNVSLSAATIKLDATNATGALSATVSAPAQPITNYSATGGPNGTPTADPITFVATGANFGTVTTAGANHQSVTISLAANSSTDLITLGIDGILPSLSFNKCTNDTTGVNGVAWAPAIASVALVSATPPPPTARTFKNIVKPKVVGTVKIGKRLTCKPGSWSPSPTRTAVQWRRDGKVIKKAVKAKYKIVRADARHRLSCTVKVSAAGYTTATAASAKTKAVPPLKKR